MTRAWAVQRFATLFQGNTARLGTEEGGSVPIAVLGRVWPSVAEHHLRGTLEPIGAYPIDPITGLCRWGCVDFDEGDDVSWVHARNLSLALSLFQVNAQTEISRSKGFHTWVFADGWIDPKIMRRALVVACELAEAPTTEVNPKQEALADGQVGNYVRLPYPGALNIGHNGHTADGRRRMMKRDGTPMSLAQWLELPNLTSPVAGLQELAAMHREPKVRTVNPPPGQGEWDDGPISGEMAFLCDFMRNQPAGNRNNALFWAASRAVDHGHDDLEPLLEAALDAGLNEREAHATISSAERTCARGY